MPKYLSGFLLLWAFALNVAFSQGDCSGDRYQLPLFPNLTETRGIEFGENVQPTLINPNARQTLYLDVYEPAGDTLSERPLLILAFGGSFVFGDRRSPDIVELCQRFARLGYVTVSIDYRLTTELIFNGSENLLYTAVLKGVHDMKAAIRFFYKDAATLQQYRIDTSRVYAGGVSAGAVVALHLAYLDRLEEIPLSMAADTAGLGGLEGLSGNPGYSSDIQGVINLCGAIGDPQWIEPGDLPAVSLHGTADEVVPVGKDTLRVLGINALVYGSSAFHPRMDSLGIPNQLYLLEGAPHTPFIEVTGVVQEYMDTVFWEVRDFLFDQLCSPSTGLASLNKHNALQIYPNPASRETRVDLGSLLARETQLQVIDPYGRTVPIPAYSEGYQWVLDLTGYPAGYYWVQVKDLKGKWQMQGKIIVL